MTEPDVDANGCCVTAERVMLESGMARRAFLHLRQGRITSIDSAPRGDSVVDMGDATLCPGLVDLHVHGIGGYDSLDATPESLTAIRRLLFRHGVTSFLPTLLTESPAKWGAALAALKEGSMPAPGFARILGVNLEGPFLSPSRAGAHNRSFLREPEVGFLEGLLARFPGFIRVVTIAPELPGAGVIVDRLVSEGIVVSLGHTEASVAQAQSAAERGATLVTHLFNSMVALHHRRAAIPAYALSEPRLAVELIADRIHVHPLIIRMVLAMKGSGGVVLVSDSIAAAGLPDGRYTVGGQHVVLRDGLATLGLGTDVPLSTLTLDRAVANMVDLGCSLPSAVEMASRNPARVLGLDGDLAVLAAGRRADFVVFDSDLRVIASAVDGRFRFFADADGHAGGRNLERARYAGDSPGRRRSHAG